MDLYKPQNQSRRLQIIVLAGVIVMIIMMGLIGILLVREYWLRDNSDTKHVAVLDIETVQGDQTLEQGFQPNTTATPLPTEALVGSVKKGRSIETPESEIALATKDIVAGYEKNRARWTATPLPTATPTPTPTPVPTFVGENAFTGLLRPDSVSQGEKWIDVNLTTQTLVAFEGNAPVFQSLVSTGTTLHPTVTGQFRIWLRFTSQDMNGYRLGYDYFLKNVPYVQYFYQDYSLHGTYWHNNFGTPMSHGCVNLPTPSAEWLFNWAEYGTLVNIHT